MKTIGSILIIILAHSIGLSQIPDTVFLEELTWTEIQSLLDAGTDTVIVPTAGTEQNGPHMALGKHKYRMNAGAEGIARELGNALVAPIMTYVPEGNIDPPSEHMRYAGTISIPNEVFESVLEYTARSLRAHGFKKILLVGDSGPNQPGMAAIATKLSKEWKSEGTVVFYVSGWYNSGYSDWLASQGFTKAQIGSHAGLRDTSTLLYVAPEHVRINLMKLGEGTDVDGVEGDPTVATPELGKVGFDMGVNAALAQIRERFGE